MGTLPPAFWTVRATGFFPSLPLSFPLFFNVKPVQHSRNSLAPVVISGLAQTKFCHLTTVDIASKGFHILVNLPGSNGYQANGGHP